MGVIVGQGEPDEQGIGLQDSLKSFTMGSNLLRALIPARIEAALIARRRLELAGL